MYYFVSFSTSSLLLSFKFWFILNQIKINVLLGCTPAAHDLKRRRPFNESKFELGLVANSTVKSVFNKNHHNRNNGKKRKLLNEMKNLIR